MLSFRAFGFLNSMKLRFRAMSQSIVEEIAPSSVFDDCTFGLLKKITHVKSLSSEGETIE
ncbi:hypothetical protein AG4045_009778, partial [Apium graveolens]